MSYIRRNHATVSLPLFSRFKKTCVLAVSPLPSLSRNVFQHSIPAEVGEEGRERERANISSDDAIASAADIIRPTKKFGRKRKKKIYIVTAHSSSVTTVACVSCPSFWRARQASRRLWHGTHRRLISRYCRLIELRASVIILFIDRATSLFPETFRRVLHFSYIAVRARLYRDISRRTILLYLFRYQREREDALFNRHVAP